MTDTPASAMQRRVRQEELVAELCAGVVRAFSGERDLHFRGRRLHRGRVALPWFAPHLHPSPESDDFSSFRGVADGLALRLTDSDAALHERLKPRRAGRAHGVRDARAVPRRSAGARASWPACATTCGTATSSGRSPSITRA
jgi:cobalamin biosynthesis protein CobT